MKISIYQINSDRDKDQVKFMGLRFLEKVNASHNVDPSLYDRVFTGDVSCRDLEAVYTMFNPPRRDDFYGHSLSVSDVVEVVDPEGCPELVGRIRFYNSSATFEECTYTDESFFLQEIRDARDVGRTIEVNDLRGLHVPLVENGFYFCDSIGFKKIEFDRDKAVDRPGLVPASESLLSLDEIIRDCEGMSASDGSWNSKYVDRDMADL